MHIIKKGQPFPYGVYSGNSVYSGVTAGTDLEVRKKGKKIVITPVNELKTNECLLIVKNCSHFDGDGIVLKGRKHTSKLRKMLNYVLEQYDCLSEGDKAIILIQISILAIIVTLSLYYLLR